MPRTISMAMIRAARAWVPIGLSILRRKGMAALGRVALLFVLAAGVSILRASDPDFKKTRSFTSVDAFVDAANEFQPASSNSDLAPLFTVPEIGQPEDPATGRPVPATAIEDTTVVWSDDHHALVFVCAAPPLQATHCEVGVLFLLRRLSHRWRIADSRKFTAAGKYADVSAELSADAGTGYQLAANSMRPIVTVTEDQGGRGYSYRLSASYTLHQSKLQRLPLE